MKDTNTNGTTTNDIDFITDPIKSYINLLTKGSLKSTKTIPNDLVVQMLEYILIGVTKRIEQNKKK